MELLPLDLCLEGPSPEGNTTAIGHLLELLSALRDAAGEITGITFISRDVREQMRTDRELRESEEKFAAAFQASPTS